MESYGLSEVQVQLHKEYCAGARSIEHRAAHAAYNTAWKSYHKKFSTPIGKRLRQKAVYHVNRSRESAEGYSRYFLANIKARATRKGLPFDLDVSDIVIPEFCPVLGIKLIKRRGKFADNSPSLDRVIPELGYVKSNVQVISYRANRIKCHASLEDLKAIVAYLERVGG